jgi:hypothetical protein
MKNDGKNDEGEAVRMELKYCERCGGLWVRECGAGVVYCGSCQMEVADLPVPKKKPQRVRMPVRPHAAVEDYGIEELSKPASGDTDFEAAGGAA